MALTNGCLKEGKGQKTKDGRIAGAGLEVKGRRGGRDRSWKEEIIVVGEKIKVMWKEWSQRGEMRSIQGELR